MIVIRPESEPMMMKSAAQSQRSFFNFHNTSCHYRQTKFSLVFELTPILQESLNVASGSPNNGDIPLLLPANLKGAKVLIIPNTSWDKSVLIFPCVGSGRCIVSREPDAVTICCSFVPANCPSIACVIEEGGWMVREYMNMDEVVAMVQSVQPQCCCTRFCCCERSKSSISAGEDLSPEIS